MKYRILTAEELQPLENDLKAFLIVNGLDGDEWKKLNAEHPEKAVRVIASFSDAVLQVVYERLRFLEFRGPDNILVFKVGKETTEMISLQWPSDSPVDLSTPEGIHAAILADTGRIQWFSSEKPTGEDREAEIHQMIEQGCIPSSEEFWKSLHESIGQ